MRFCLFTIKLLHIENFRARGKKQPHLIQGRMLLVLTPVIPGKVPPEMQLPLQSLHTEGEFWGLRLHSPRIPAASYIFGHLHEYSAGTVLKLSTRTAARKLCLIHCEVECVTRGAGVKSSLHCTCRLSCITLEANGSPAFELKEFPALIVHSSNQL